MNYNEFYKAYKDYKIAPDFVFSIKDIPGDNHITLHYLPKKLAESTKRRWRKSWPPTRDGS